MTALALRSAEGMIGSARTISPIQIIGQTTANADGVAGSGTTIVLPTATGPGAAVGDLLVVWIQNGLNGGLASTPAGWTELVNQQDSSGASTEGLLAYRIATGTEAASYTWTIPAASTKFVATMFRLSGTHPTAPIRTSAFNNTNLGASGTTDFVAPSLTGVQANDRVFFFWAMGDAASGVQPGSYYPLPTGYSQIFNRGVSTKGSLGLIANTDGPQTAPTFTAGTTNEWYVSAGLAVIPNVVVVAQNYTESPADPEGLVDAVTLDRATTAADILGATDAVSLDRATTAADALGATDSVTVDLAVARSASAADSLGAVDAATSALGLSQTAADSAGLADAASQVQALARTAAEVAGLTDTATPAQGFDRTAADAAGLADSSSVLQGLARTAADPIGATDDVSAVLAGANAQTPADSLGLVDAAASLQDAARTVGDVLGATDSSQAVLDALRATADPLGLVDGATAVITSGPVAYTASPADTVGIGDAVSVVLTLGPRDYTASPADTVGIGDAVTATFGLNVPPHVVVRSTLVPATISATLTPRAVTAALAPRAVTVTLATNPIEATIVPAAVTATLTPASSSATLVKAPASATVALV